MTTQAETRAAMASEQQHEQAAPAELPPSETWSPAQALAAAARVEWQGVVIIGDDGSGEAQIRHSRMGQKDMLFLAELLRDYAMTM